MAVRTTITPGLRLSRRAGVILLAVVFVGAAAWMATDETPDAVGRFTLGARQITVDRFEPAGDADGRRHPAIIMLHGIDGARKYGRYYRAFARELADLGYVVLVVHYFDDLPYENLLGRERQTVVDQVFADRDEWIDTVAHATRYAAGLESVDRNRIGLLGFSLGGYVSLAVAERAVQDASFPRPAAVVEYFGGLFEDKEARPVVSVRDFPPVLILHGQLDTDVPVRKAHELKSHLEAHNVVHQMRIYPEQGHVFHGDDSLDASRLTIDFYARHLGLRSLQASLD